MSDEEALLAAIIANPDEDTPRLAYADWLDEHDQPERAEFIRLQIENAGQPIAERQREVELLRRRRKQWDKPFQLLFPGGVFTYSRGFIVGVRTEWRFYQSSIVPLLRMTPIEQIIVGKSYAGSLSDGNYRPYSSQPPHVRFRLALYAPDGRGNPGDLDILRLEPLEMEPFLLQGRWIIGCSQLHSWGWNLPDFPILEYANAVNAGARCRLAMRPFKRLSEFDTWLPEGFRPWSDCWVVFQDGEVVDIRPANRETDTDWLIARFAE